MSFFRDLWHDTGWPERVIVFLIFGLLFSLVLGIAMGWIRECPEGTRCVARTPNSSGTVIMSDGKVGFVSSGGECLKCE